MRARKRSFGSLRLRAAADVSSEEHAMDTVSVLWSVWGALVLLMAAVRLYASRLGKNEEDQLFLADSSSHERSEQLAIAERLHRIQPVKRTTLALFAAMTAVMVVYYVFDMIHQFRP
jgi:hypothetical protein